MPPDRHLQGATLRVRHDPEDLPAYSKEYTRIVEIRCVDCVTYPEMLYVMSVLPTCLTEWMQTHNVILPT